MRRDSGLDAMIGRIHPRGSDVRGALAYLFGPGREDEHTDPRLVATWDQLTPLADQQPHITASGQPDLTGLTALLEASVPSRAAAGHVWHASVRTHPADRPLSDTEWGHAARDIVAHLGIDPHDNAPGGRWIAVRHVDATDPAGGDHIHILATLAAADGTTVRTAHEKRRLREAARQLEDRHGLRATAPAHTAGHAYETAAEQRKAARTGQTDTAREWLRRAVTFAAAAADGPDAFFARLHRRGILTTTRRDATGAITGYTVADPAHTTAAGLPVRYAGGSLARDLTWPRLLQRWSITTGTAHPGPDLTTRTRAAVAAATTALPGLTPEEAAGTAQAACDLLTVVTQLAEHTGPEWNQAATAAHRAAREPAGRIHHASHAAVLRDLTRQLAATTAPISGAGPTTRARELADLTAILAGLARLIEVLADIRDQQHRPHQARPAREAAAVISARTTTATPATPPAGGDGDLGGVLQRLHTAGYLTATQLQNLSATNEHTRLGHVLDALGGDAFTRLARAITAAPLPSDTDLATALAWRLAHAEPDLAAIVTDPAAPTTRHTR
ncbi:relaxase [Phytomonospora sp. NPDC050363]|uniref:relaxase/mobilization nuclease domain-containing protein n=1 Tax=Phytomonospora sp. NPDC050363 TaxID=3155642 RepID=UPI0033C9B5AD